MERVATIEFTKLQARARAITAAIKHEGMSRPTFARSSQNMAEAAVLLDTLPAPPTDGVNKMYRQLRDNLSIAAEQ
jgi:hypothetical protein